MLGTGSQPCANDCYRAVCRLGIRGFQRPDCSSLRTRNATQGSERVKQLLASSRALLLPSFAEGLPVVIMEALALGRPAVTTYIAGIPELVNERCGWIVPAGSVESLADSMRAALLSTPAELAAKARYGHAQVEQAHDLQVNSKELLRQFVNVH